MIKKDLLQILACPETRQPLAEADQGLVDRLNAAIEKGTLQNVGGAAVTETLEAALVREDGSIAYALRQGIPLLLSEEGFPVPG